MEAPARRAAAADQQALGRRRDRPQVRLAAAQRTGAAGPARSDRLAMIASAARVRNGRIACSSTVSRPATPAATPRPPGADRFVPGTDAPGQPRPASRRRPSSARRRSSSSSASWLRIAAAVARSRNRRSLQSIGRCSNCRIGPLRGARPDSRCRAGSTAAARATARAAGAAAARSGDRPRRPGPAVPASAPELGDFPGLRAGLQSFGHGVDCTLQCRRGTGEPSPVRTGRPAPASTVVPGREPAAEVRAARSDGAVGDRIGVQNVEPLEGHTRDGDRDRGKTVSRA